MSTNANEDDARRLLELFTALGRKNSLRDPIAHAVESWGFTHSQLHALLWLGVDTRLTMGELAQRTGITEKTATGVVDRLEREGYVRRAREDTDRRVVRVELTEKGRQAYSELDVEIVNKTRLILSLLEREDITALFRIVERLTEKLSQATPDEAPATKNRSP